MREGAKRRSWVLGLLKVTKNQSFLTRSTTSTSTLRINESTTVFERFMSLRIEIGEIMNRRRSMFFVALNSLASANCFFLRKSPWKASKLIKIDYKYDNVKEISEEAPLYVSWTSGSILFALILMFKGCEYWIHRHVWRSSNTWLQLLEVPKISAFCREAGSGWEDAMAYHGMLWL